MTDTGLIREDKQGKRNPSEQANPSEQREKTVASRKETNRAIERNPEQSISTPTPRVYITNP